MTLPIPARVAERAASRYIENPDGCFISTYSTASHGYAQIGWWEKSIGKNQMTTAHRAVWVHLTGAQIPEGMTIDHLCFVRPCVNPAHLRMLPLSENARRTNGRDWPMGECAHGHDNSWRRQRTGKLVCLLCERIRQQAKRAEQRDHRTPMDNGATRRPRNEKGQFL